MDDDAAEGPDEEREHGAGLEGHGQGEASDGHDGSERPAE